GERGVELDSAAMLLHDAVDGGEAKTGAALLGRKERLEDARAVLERDPRTSVAHRQTRPVLGGAAAPGRHLDANQLAARRSLSGIAQQIPHHLAELRRITVDPHRRRRLELDAHVAESLVVLEDQQHLGEHGGKVEALEVDAAWAREVEQPGDERVEA